MSIDCFEEKKLRFFSSDDLEDLRRRPVPRHVAIIMDGNRRWEMRKFIFQSKEYTPEEGHWKGAKVLVNVVESALELGIKVLTVFGFSTENWTRSRQEIDLLFKIFEVYLQDNKQRMVDQGIRFHVIGDLEPIPASLVNTIEDAQNATKEGDQMDFVVAFNYGARDELKRVMVALANDCSQKKISPETITEELIGSYLDTHAWGDPDLLIRTSGELRLSNFLLWQLAYTEIYVTEVLWPDFTPLHFLGAIKNFQVRQRRLGR